MVELGPRALLNNAVDLDVQLLVVERDQAGYLLALRQGRRIGPGEILTQRLADSHAPRLGPPLVGAVGDRRRALEEVHPRVRAREVVTRREPCLERGPRARRVCRGE